MQHTDSITAIFVDVFFQNLEWIVVVERIPWVFLAWKAFGGQGTD